MHEIELTQQQNASTTFSHKNKSKTATNGRSSSERVALSAVGWKPRPAYYSYGVRDGGVCMYRV